MVRPFTQRFHISRSLGIGQYFRNTSLCSSAILKHSFTLRIPHLHRSVKQIQSGISNGLKFSSEEAGIKFSIFLTFSHLKRILPLCLRPRYPFPKPFPRCTKPKPPVLPFRISTLPGTIPGRCTNTVFVQMFSWGPEYQAPFYFQPISLNKKKVCFNRTFVP